MGVESTGGDGDLGREILPLMPRRRPRTPEDQKVQSWRHSELVPMKRTLYQHGVDQRKREKTNNKTRGEEKLTQTINPQFPPRDLNTHIPHLPRLPRSKVQNERMCCVDATPEPIHEAEIILCPGEEVCFVVDLLTRYKQRGRYFVLSETRSGN